MSIPSAQYKNYGRRGVRTSPEPPETPYMRARKEWDLRIGSAAVQAKNWRLNSGVLAGLLLCSMAGNIYLGRQPKTVPHVIEIDSLGAATYRGPVGESQFTPSEAILKYHLRRFIELTRTVSSDNVVLRNNWFDAYKMLTTTGNTLLTAWVQANDPFKRAQFETTAVEVLSVVPISQQSWQIDWKETSWDARGIEIGRPFVWRAMLRIALHRPETTEQMIDNPVGVYVDEFHWDKVQEVQ